MREEIQFLKILDQQGIIQLYVKDVIGEGVFALSSSTSVTSSG